jgi:hypothetical protein
MLINIQAMVYMKKSTITPRPQVSRTDPVPKLTLELAGRDGIDLRNDLSEKNKQPIAISTKGPVSSPNGRRKATRYQFNATVVIRWLGIDEQIHQAFGIVRDISTSGVFIETTAPLCLNANVELDIAPPSRHGSSSGPELEFEGRVVRAIDHNGQHGFAIAGAFTSPS